MSQIKLPHLETRSVYDVARENFEAAHLSTYAIRFIYTGEHALSKNELIEQFSKSVNCVNAQYTDIPVNGLLLVYDSYFVHILEGSEDTLYRQLRFMFANENDWIDMMNRKDEDDDAAAEAAALAAAEEAAAEGIPYEPDETPKEPRPERIVFKRLKLLMAYHSITTLRFSDWRAITGRPPSLVGKLDIYGSLADHMEQLHVCLNKIEKLCSLAKDNPNLSFEGVTANDPKMEALPEVALLDFLLTSPHVLDLRHILSLHRCVDDYVFYFEHVWPVPTHYTPRFLYKLKVDDSFVEPLPVMPWEVKKEPTEDEEKDQDQQSQSSSDG